jgi:hypothetical protein
LVTLQVQRPIEPTVRIHGEQRDGTARVVGDDSILAKRIDSDVAGAIVSRFCLTDPLELPARRLYAIADCLPIIVLINSDNNWFGWMNIEKRRVPLTIYVTLCECGSVDTERHNTVSTLIGI